MKILGIDPGTRNLGWAVLNKKDSNLKFRKVGVIEPEGEGNNRKLYDAFNKLRELISEEEPQAVAIERTFYSKNVQTTLRLGEIIASAVIAAIERDIEPVQIPPKKVKLAVTGNGNASKKQVAFMIKNLLNISNENLSNDETDAIAIAFTWESLQKSY